MRIVLFLCFCLAVSADKADIKKKSECDGVHVRGEFYKKEVLGRGLNRPYQIAVLHHFHKIFFSYNTGKDEEDTFGIGYIEKNHTRHKVLEEIENGFALAADNVNGVAFFGGSNGIYKYTEKENKVKKILHDKNIWDMFYHKKVLYFIDFPKQHLYKFHVHDNDSSPERVSDIHEQIYQFAIDKDSDKYITNSTGLFRIKSGSKNRIYYEGPKIFRAVEVNNKEELFLCGKNGIYVVNKKIHKLEEIAQIQNIFGLAFDRDDHFIYSDPHEIIRLRKESCK